MTYSPRMAIGPKSFRLEVSEAAISDLRERLARTRFPDEPPLEAWSTGTSLSYLKDLLRYWQRSFDWRSQEAKLNAFRQHRVSIRGIELHYIHEPGRGANPMPLLVSHGWPGSVWEFNRLIPLLTEEFTVVAPSLPGFTLSFTPGQPRFGVEEMADLFAELMSDVLGYKRFGAQGGDWGAFISSRLGYAHPERLTGIHLNYLPVRRDKQSSEPDWTRQLAHWTTEESAYAAIQGTKPQALAYGLTDSPAGLAAWIGEKFRAWSDEPIGPDDVLTNIALYWFTGAIGSSFWPYYARAHRGWPVPEGKTIDVPVGYAEFPKEILRPPRSVADKTYTDIRRWTAMKKRGHFAALEQPEALAAEIKAFFRPLGG
jgi:pimeloyl-ACP methyl ester carboxylesterase